MSDARPTLMTDRERFIAHMHFEPVDRCPLWDFGFLDHTRTVWQQQGLPVDADTTVPRSSVSRIAQRRLASAG